MNGVLQPIAILLFLVSLAVSNDEPKPLPMAIFGSWRIVSIESRSQTLTEDELEEATIEIDAKAIEMKPTVLLRVDETIFTNASPTKLRYENKGRQKDKNAISVFYPSRSEKPMLGIYASSGKQLKLCLNLDGTSRPSKFDAKENPFQIVFTLKRP